MATVILQAVGAAVGSAIAGPVGAIIGRAAGAAAGYAIDQQLFSQDRVIEGPRLDSSRLLSSTEGTPVPKVYGRNRLSGQIIWATRFEETVSEQGGSGKGGPSGPTTRTYSYFCNLAVGICEGPVAGIRRVWADAQELDLTGIEYRFYNGDEDQLPDPLIEAKQGSGNTPAYRGMAYVVFEALPLARYGNRIPQLSFEIIRPTGRLESEIRSISVIPGATEYGYDTKTIPSGGGTEKFAALNRHTTLAETDWQASIDELQMLCPNLETVSLVVTWYGTDLRAGECEIVPGVTHNLNAGWNVAGLQRHQAHLVSQVNGHAAFGGTPTDASVVNAIRDLKDRGLKVVFYPFLMMDIEQDNTLPWLDNTLGQPAYPWRGEISCFPPPGATGSVDKTTVAGEQLNAFSQRYNSMVTHYATLCVSAGGVDGFLTGSELRGLTRVRDGSGNFPFVDNLKALTLQVRNILGPSCRLSYGADWSEYFGYQPQDGSGDVLFNLDPLWAMPQIDAVGIDNYMPLSDWQADRDPSSPETGSIHDRRYLMANIAANEGFDWFYASARDRNDRVRTPITDGAENEPWVYRYKDLVSWWSEPHHDRLQGVRQPVATQWLPQSKPLWFTELGCPAIDKGSNQPNVFFDEKSAQSAIPYHSGGGRDDLVQRRFLEAHYDYWKEPSNNPVSQHTGTQMLSSAEITPWTWDARPFPWFPVDEEIWADGVNWHTGHWLTGRLGGCAVDDLIAAILEDFGFGDAIIEVDGYVDGYAIPGAVSARAALEPLIALFNINVAEEAGRLSFRSPEYGDRLTLDMQQLVQEGEQPAVSSTRQSETELPEEAVVHHVSVFGEYQDRASKSRRLEGRSDRQITLQTGVVMAAGLAENLAETRLRRDWGSREELRIGLSTQDIAVSPGDVVGFSGSLPGTFLVTSVERGVGQQLTLRSLPQLPGAGAQVARERGGTLRHRELGAPDVVLMDLPLLRASDNGKLVSHLAVSADPWGRDYAVFTSPGEDGFVLRGSVRQQAVTGRLEAPFDPGTSGVWDRGSKLRVRTTGSGFQSRDEVLVLNGENVLAVQSATGDFEIVQFQVAQLQADGSWELSVLLRGQLGTEAEMHAGAPIGARIVLLNSAIAAIEMDAAERNLPMNWRVGPAANPVSSERYTHQTFANSARNRTMLSPAHLRCAGPATGDHHYSWIRRGRIDADSWEDADIPLDAQSEKYIVRIFNEAGTPIREAMSPSPYFDYSAAQRVADLGSAAGPFVIRVAQIGDNGSPGQEATLVQNFD